MTEDETLQRLQRACQKGRLTVTDVSELAGAIHIAKGIVQRVLSRTPPERHLPETPEHRLLKRLEEITRTLGIKLTHSPTAGNAGMGVVGTYAYLEKRLYLANHLEGVQRIRVWLHELAHALLGEPAIADRLFMMDEPMADTVTAIILEHFGLDAAESRSRIGWYPPLHKDEQAKATQTAQRLIQLLEVLT